MGGKCVQRKLRSKIMPKKDEEIIEVTTSSGNVFADLKIPNHEPIP